MTANAIALYPCRHCRKPAEAPLRYSIHRDGFGIGPEVPLCAACAEDDSITCEMIWGLPALDRDSASERRAFLAQVAELLAARKPAGEEGG